MDEAMRDYLIGFDPANDGPHYRIRTNYVWSDAFDLDLYNPEKKRWIADSYSKDRALLEQRGVEWETCVNIGGGGWWKGV